VYNYYIGYSILKYSYTKFYSLLDKGFIEKLGPQGLSFLIYEASVYVSTKQSGYIYTLGCLLCLSFLLILNISLIF